MRLGTPLAPGATKVMLLGPAARQESLIALRGSASETIAVDRYPNAPDIRSHRARVIDMTDPSAIRAVVEAERHISSSRDRSHRHG
jgi:phosphoribosylglycinamide formyltransferase 2